MRRLRVSTGLCWGLGGLLGEGRGAFDWEGLGLAEIANLAAWGGSLGPNWPFSEFGGSADCLKKS
jgi:hypothetical protein